MAEGSALHLWPRALRWRLLLGFVLSIVLLQIGLVVAERLLLQRALVGSMQSTMEAFVRASLSSVIQPQQKKSVNVVGVAMDQASTRLLIAMQNTVELKTLASTLALPDQPVVLLDTRGKVLFQTGTLSADRTRTTPLAPAVMRSLARAASSQTRRAVQGSSMQVSTADGSYVGIVEPTSVPIVDVPLSKQQFGEAVLAWKRSGGTAVDPSIRSAAGPLRTDRLVVVIAHRMADTEQTIATVTTISMVGLALVITLAALLSFVVVGRALRPLTVITHGAERLAAGDYGYRVDVPEAGDEIGRLGAVFNRMAEAIGSSFAAQRRFVADASHELRTPLTALRGYVDVLLLGALEDRVTSRRILAAMQEDLTRMTRLVNDLLMLARFDAKPGLQLTAVPVADLLSAARDEGIALSHGTRTIVLQLVPPGLAVRGDRDRLRQVLSNLVANACAYCPEGSTIHLEAQPDGFSVTLLVRDDGPGIPAGELARLGERFYRGDFARSRHTGGSGLGLAIARSIVEAHGGSLHVESVVGIGTTVAVQIERVRAARNDASPSVPVAGDIA